MPRHRSIEISVEPNEVVVGEPRLEVRVQSPLDPETARGAIVLESTHGRVSLSDDRRVASFVPENGLAAGPQTLLIEELVSARGKRLSDRLEVPFFISDSRAKVDARLRVESIVRLRVGRLGTVRVSAAKRPAGKFIELMKAVDRESGSPVELGFDQDGASVDTSAIFEQIEKNRRATFGKLHPALKEAVARAGEGERIPVAVWFRVGEEPLHEKREKGQSARPPRSEVAHAKRIKEAGARVVEIVREHGAADEPRPDPDVPVVFAELPIDGIKRLQERKEVAALFLHDTKGEVDLSNSMAIAQSDTVHSSLSVTGSGVNVAVYEDGPDVTTNLLSITARFLTNPNTDDHARHTHGIIKNIEANKPHGHAKDCNLHSANSMDLAAINWAARTRGCTVISQSFHRSAEQTNSGLSFDDMYKDWLALHWPYPTIVEAAGNGSSTEFVNHKGFNRLTVANHDDSAAALASDSVFRNPGSPHSDRELPEIGANGMFVTCVGLTKSGTSMAAPATASAAALLQQTNSTLKSWPEGCRAILLAGASKNITGNTWWSDRTAAVDAQDGTGALDALESVRIAQNRRSRGSAGARRGWDVGTLRSSDIGGNGETTFSYKVSVPFFFFGAKVKVGLAWDSLATLLDLGFIQIAGDNLQLDLDLKIYDSGGSLVGYSGSWDNSYEIAEFSARRGETYTIKIRRWSGTEDVWYGIAWTVQGTPFIRENWDLTERIVRLANE
jgi:subtilase family protein